MIVSVVSDSGNGSNDSSEDGCGSDGNNDGDDRDGDVCVFPLHDKVISGFQALRQAKAPIAGLEPEAEGCRYQGGLASPCATDAPMKAR
ncbi:hypothetical protein PoB_002651400 [Plakobranchus ocellatus]|uniref:Uncharacterized protein n=1 Tax=Plakobranchus ocellatus TaxID=259542 RepID=A0AAV4A090_9GAST|nr:hypothetical protein PoB_002651400 [Plakobranchus ocellatus]